MACDERYAAMYRILAYLHGCERRGEAPRESAYDARALGVPDALWRDAMRELAGHGFVRGVSVEFRRDGGIRIVPHRARVSEAGAELLRENPAMKEARAFLEEAGVPVPSA